MAALAAHHAVVTGGGRGIGRAVAAALSGAGAAVTVVGRSEASLKEAVAQGNARTYIVADVTDSAALASGMKRAADANGPIDILVANAGAAESASFAKSSPELFRRLFEINTLGVVNAAQAVLGDMIARKSGRIVVVASTAGLRGSAYVSAYCASKHAVLGVVRSVAAETMKSGVTINAVCPSYVDTDMVDSSLQKITQLTGRSREEGLASMLKANPLGRLITVEEVAAAVLFLCSPEAAAISGSTITLGGEV